MHNWPFGQLVLWTTCPQRGLIHNIEASRHIADSVLGARSTVEDMTYQPATHPEDLSADTIVVAAGRPPRGHDSPVNPPIVLSSTYVGTGTVVDGDRAYGRYSNPTWDPLEDALGQLEGATLPALILSSGLAAVSAALSLIPAGGVLVMPTHSYQGALVMAQEQAAKGLFTLRAVDIANNDEVIEALTGTGGKAADMLWLESPTNPMLEVADIAVLCRSAQAVGALIVTDNTFSTPLVQKPLELGADVVLHSVTKYLAGHSDVVLGALVTSNPALREALLHHRSIHGAIAGPSRRGWPCADCAPWHCELSARRRVPWCWRNALTCTTTWSGFCSPACLRIRAMSGPRRRCPALAPSCAWKLPEAKKLPMPWWRPCGCGLPPRRWAGWNRSLSAAAAMPTNPTPCRPTCCA